MERLCKRITGFFAFFLMAVLGILTLVSKDRSFSEDENRVLAQAPEVSVSKILDGSFQEETEKYLNDQVYDRTDLMKLYAISQISLLRTNYNGVYVCEGDWLVEEYKEPVNTEKHIERFGNIAQKLDTHCMLMLVPTAVTMYPEVLPYGASSKQLEVKDKVYEECGMETIEVTDTLQKAKDEGTQLYYYTDHHWTTDAAYAAYLKFCEQEGFTPYDGFTRKIVSRTFLGTVYSKALTPFQKTDEIAVYEQDMTGITVTYPDGEGELYNPEYLEVKDQYAYFLNGLNPTITVKNSNVKNGKKLMVVKDSYANCFIPFLINHYEEIMILDTRYYRMGVSTAAASFEPTDVLFLFNLNTFDTEVALAGIF